MEERILATQNNTIALTTLQKEILNLERKYFYILHNTFTSTEFINDIRAIEKSIQSQYGILSLFSQKKNKIATALERLMRFYMYKVIKPTSIYHSSLSSDLAYYTDDALINIDAKSIDIDSNLQDKDKVTVEKNQISFENIPVYSKGGFPGFRYSPRLPSVDSIKQLPTLTYFIKCIYEDTNTSFNLVGISLACVPNGELGNLFNNDLITGFKTYEYISVTMANQTTYAPYSPTTTKNSSWIKLRPYGTKRSLFLDNTLRNPLYVDDPIVWVYKDKKYHVCIDGTTARIDADYLKHRYDPYNNPWTGYIYIDL